MALTDETARLLGGKCCLLTITHGGSRWRSVLERESSEVSARSPPPGLRSPVPCTPITYDSQNQVLSFTTHPRIVASAPTLFGSHEMARRRPLDPLNGITLEMMLNQLVAYMGWEAMGIEVPIRCFTHDPGIQSSLKFLRRTPWARTKVEWLYRNNQKKMNIPANEHPEP